MKEQILNVPFPASTDGGILAIKVQIPDPTITTEFTQPDITETHTATLNKPPVVVTPPPTTTPAVRKNLILNVDFADGKLPTSLSAQPSNRFLIKQINGKNYCEITCAKSDDVIPAVTGSNRSEFNVPTSQAETYKDGAVRWYGVRYNLPKSFIADAAMELLYQLHEYTGSASPGFALWTMGGHWCTALGGVKKDDLGAYEFDKDTDFVFKIKYSTVAAGFVEVYKNGERVKTYPGLSMPPDTKLPYMKCGIYKWSWKKGPASNPSSIVSRTINIGALYIGNELASLQDVSP